MDEALFTDLPPTRRGKVKWHTPVEWVQYVPPITCVLCVVIAAGISVSVHRNNGKVSLRAFLWGAAAFFVLFLVGFEHLHIWRAWWSRVMGSHWRRFQVISNLFQFHICLQALVAVLSVSGIQDAIELVSSIFVFWIVISCLRSRVAKVTRV